MPTISINGKFLAQRTTGVQRVAYNLLQALDRELDAGDHWDWELICPAGVQSLRLGHIKQRKTTMYWPLFLWEQLSLPMLSEDLLLNIGGTAPWGAQKQVGLLHDAAVFDHPAAYRPMFVRWYRLLFRRLARTAPLLFTGSQDARERLASHLHLDSSRMHVLPWGCDHLDAVTPDPHILERLGVREGSYVLTVGSANPTKNLNLLWRALNTPPCPEELRVVTVGGRNKQVFTNSQPIHTEHADRIIDAGAVDDPGLVQLYRSARALVFPSLYEGYGLPVLEAMRQGCPVVAASATALPETCGGAARLFDPTSAEQLAENLHAIWHDESLRQQLIDAGRHRAAKQTWQVCAKSCLSALQPLMSGIEARA